MNEIRDPGSESARTDHIFVDCENVNSIPEPLLALGNVVVTLVIGRAQKSQSLALSRMLAHHQIIPRFVESPLQGKNSLDFILSFLIGETVKAHPEDGFHIVADDTGYDSLVEYLNSRGVETLRHPQPDGSAVAKKIQKKTPAKTSSVLCQSQTDRVRKILENTVITNRPRNKKALESFIRNLKRSNDPEIPVDDLIATLTNRSILSFTDSGTVKYKPTKPTAA